MEKWLLLSILVIASICILKGVKAEIQKTTDTRVQFLFGSFVFH